MKVELFPFQKRALNELRSKSVEAVYRYGRTRSNQVVSFTAPTGAGKTIIMASLIESILFGDEINRTAPASVPTVWSASHGLFVLQERDGAIASFSTSYFDDATID